MTGGGDIITTLTEEGGVWDIDVKIHPADEEKICRLWNEPGARAAADAAALSRFAETHYAPRAAPWEGGVAIVQREDDDEDEDETPDVSDDAPETAEELTPVLISRIFYSLSLYAAADEGEVEAVLTAVGERIDSLVGENASATWTLFLELERARSKRRTGGPANLSRIWNAVSRPSWDPESRGFLARALAARAGLVKPAYIKVPALLDDDGELIYNASTSPGFQELWDQYRADEGDGMARASLQRNQKLAGSLEAYRDKADYSDDEGPASVVPGDRVDAFWDRRPDRGWYAATVISVDADTSTCTVRYDDRVDASRPFRLIRERVPAPDVVFAAGDRVHSDFEGCGKYSGATVVRRRRGAYDLEFDNGWTEPGVHADRVWP